MMACPSKKSALASFTLVEVVLALGVMSIGLVGVLSIFPTALNAARDSKQETRVAMLAQAIFSDVRARNVLERDGGIRTENVLQNAEVYTNYYTAEGELTSVDLAALTCEVLVTNSTLLPNGMQVTATFVGRGSATNSPAVFTSLFRIP